MTTTPEQNLDTAVAYLRAFERKDPEEIARYLHTEVRYHSPNMKLNGKAALVEAAKHFSAAMNSFPVHARFAAGAQVMLAYDIEGPEPIGVQPAAQLMTFRDGLIAEVRAYFDPRPFSPPKKGA